MLPYMITCLVAHRGGRLLLSTFAPHHLSVLYWSPCRSMPCTPPRSRASWRTGAAACCSLPT